MSFVVEKQFQTVLAPVAGSVVALQITTAVTVVDLTSIPTSGALAGRPDQVNPIGKYIRIVADAGPLYVLTGPTAASVGSMSLTSYSSVASNEITVTGNECVLVPTGTYVDVLIQAGGTPQTTKPAGARSPCRYLGLVSSATATARLYQRSP